MDSQKRKRDELLREESLKTPKKRTVAGVDFQHWETEETCSYLRQHGLGEWEPKFRGELVSASR